MIWRNSVYYIIYLKLASSIFDEIRRIKLFTRNSWRSSSYLWTIENDQFGQSMAFVNDNLLSLVYSSSSSTSLVLQFVYFVIISLRKGIKIYFALLIYIYIYPSFPFLLFRFICSIENWQEEVDAAFYFARSYRRHYRCRIEIQLAHDFPLVLRFAGGRDQSR